MIELMLIFSSSYVFHDMNIFWPESFVKFPWGFQAEFSKYWKDLRKTLRSHENLRSLTDLNGGNTGFRSNSRNWVFRMFMMSKVQSINEKEHAVSC